MSLNPTSVVHLSLVVSTFLLLLIFQEWTLLHRFFEDINRSTVVNVFGIFPVYLHLLDFAGSLFECKNYRSRAHNSGKFWGESLLACYIGRFGGTTIVGLMLGQPASWIMSLAGGTSLFIAWWLVFAMPGDYFWSKLMNSQLFLGCIDILNHISVGHAITTAGVDKVVFNTFHLPRESISAAIIPAILAGTISSTGGGVMADTLCVYEVDSFYPHKKPNILCNSIVGDATRSRISRSFVCSLLYYVILNPVGIFPWSSSTAWLQALGHTVVCYLFVLSSVKSTILLRYYGKDIHFAGRLMSTILRFMNISKSVSFD